MNTYEVTFAAASHAFKNTACMVDETKAAEIRQLLYASMKNHEPLVYGRDWDHETITEIFTLTVEADEYSIAGDTRVAHFYTWNATRSGKQLVRSVLGVTTVRLIQATAVAPPE